MNIPQELVQKMNSGQLPTEKKFAYEKGAEISQFGETFVLLERLNTVPTSLQWAKANWRVGFRDRNGHLDESSKYVRPVTEIGNPNNHAPEPIPGMNWVPDESDDMSDEESLEDDAPAKPRPAWKPKQKAGRGRPEGPMNELKAKNIFRNTAKGTLDWDEIKIAEAKAFILTLEEGDKFVQKYEKKFENIVR